jgi:hypothetical protein
MHCQWYVCVTVCPESPAADADVAEIPTANSVDDSLIPTSSRTPVPFASIIPVPRSVGKRNDKVGEKQTTKRKVGHAKMITASPYKQSLEESAAKKSSERCPNKTIPRRRPASKVIKSTELTKAAVNLRQSRNKHEEHIGTVTEDRTPCMYCEIIYCNSNISWISCKRCKRWACEDCVKLGKKKSFICSDCS